MKRFYFFILFFLLFSGWSQDSDFESWKKNEEMRFQQFMQQDEAMFAEFLEDEWRRFSVFKGEVLDAVPKIEEPPVYGEYKKLRESQSVDSRASDAPKLPSEHTESLRVGDSCRFYFCNIPVSVDLFPEIDTAVNTGTPATGISQYYLAMLKRDTGSSVRGLQAIKDEYALNDWGFLHLVEQFVHSIHKNTNDLVALTWFFLLKSGIDVRIGYDSQGNLYLIVPFREMVYGTSYFTVNRTRYYLLDTQVNEPLYIYEVQNPGQPRVLSLRMDRLPLLPPVPYTRRVSFEYGGRHYDIDIEYDASLVQYFNEYPQTDQSLYFKIPFSTNIADSIGKVLMPIIRTSSAAEGVNIILRFIQTAFSYQTDEEQFGREKWMIPDETIYYPYCDCEDRSILFTALVRKLMELPVIALDWPGHIAAAVGINEDVGGDFILYSGTKFYICDPTYINADIGMIMPVYRNTGVTVIDISGTVK